jgi:putative oxidoreductase
VGGILLAIGLFTRPIALILFIEMLVITNFHWPRGFFFSAQGGGYEYPMMWAAVLLYFVIRGGGDWSVDAKLKKEF